MLPEDARFHGFEGAIAGAAQFIPVYDADQRKQFQVTLSEDMSMSPGSDSDQQWYTAVDKALSTLKSIVDEVAPDVLELEVDGSGKVTALDHATDWTEYLRSATHYPKLEEFSLPEASTKSILRSEITELDRLSSHVELVSYSGLARGETAVFKYFLSFSAGFEGWQEINIHARLPPHPNLMPLQRLVLEEITGSRVVGFAMPFMASGRFDDFDKNSTPCFKLKYLKQLMQVIDDLNLTYGIVHQDIAPRNLLLDRATDAIRVFDFGNAAHIGHDNLDMVADRHVYRCTMQARDDRNDVKGVILALHEIITRDPSYTPSWLHNLDEEPLRGHPDKWHAHPDVKLDAPARAYYDALMAWQARRRDPAAPQPAKLSYKRAAAVEQGLPFVEWVRPSGARLDRSRRLLATGRYADEEKKGAEGGSAGKTKGNKKRALGRGRDASGAGARAESKKLKKTLRRRATNGRKARGKAVPFQPAGPLAGLLG